MTIAGRITSGGGLQLSGQLSEGSTGISISSSGSLEIMELSEMPDCLAFDGIHDYVDCGTSSAYDLITAITVELWVYLPSEITTNPVLISKRNNSTYAWELYLASGTRYFTARINSNFNSVGLTASVPLNMWTHLAMTYDKTSIKAYMNGVLGGTTSYTTNISTSTSAVQIGRRNYTGSEEYVNARISDVRIWNLARTETEIQNNMYKRLTGAESGLVGYWKINEGTGTTITDSTANVNHGALQGTTWAYRTNGKLSMTMDGIVTIQGELSEGELL